MIFGNSYANTCRQYPMLLDQLFSYLTIILKKGEDIDREISQLLGRSRLSTQIDYRPRLQQEQKAGISEQIRSLERLLNVM